MQRDAAGYYKNTLQSTEVYYIHTLRYTVYSKNEAAHTPDTKEARAQKRQKAKSKGKGKGGEGGEQRAQRQITSLA